MSSQAVRLAPLDPHYRRHHHPYHQIVIGWQGRVRMDVGNVAAQLDERMGCILPAHTLHGYQGMGSNSLLVIDIACNAPCVIQHGQTLARLFQKGEIFALDEGLWHCLQFLSHEGMTASEAHWDVLLHALLSTLVQRLQPHALRDRLDMQVVDTYIDQHLSQPIRVEQLAKLCHLSPAHFTTLFRRQCNTSPYQYVKMRRLNEAARLVRETLLPLSLIAEQTHFADQSALSHAFRRHLATTPRQLRTAPLHHTARISCP